MSASRPVLLGWNKYPRPYINPKAIVAGASGVYVVDRGEVSVLRE